MKGISGLLFVAFLAQFGHRSLSSSGAPLENPFPLGTIGCLASDVCGPGEVCKDDLLFGSCQNRHSRHGTIRPDSNSGFHLKSRQIELLEDAILKLIQDGFTWQDAYTQCTLQNLLVAFQRNDHFNPGLCKDALGVSVSSSSLAKEADTEIAAILKELLQSTGIGRQEKDPSGPLSNLEETYEDDYPEEESNGLEASDYEEGGLDFQNSNKRDEFVQVHKYFDKSQGQLKRAHFLHLDENADQYNFLTAFPEKPVREDAKDFLPEEEAEHLQYMLKENVLDPDDLRDKPTGQFFDLSQVRQDSIGLESSMGSPEDAKEGSSGIVASDGTSDKENNGSLLSLSSSDQDTLEKLLEGSLDPDHLPVDKLRRLSRYIELMISLLEMQGNKHLEDVDVVTEESETLELPPTADNPIATQQAASSATKSAVEENVKEPVDDNIENKSDTDGEIAGKPAFLVAEPPPDSLNVDKKSPPIDDVIKPKSPEDESDKKAVVKTRYTYIKFDTNVNDEDAQRFLSNLTHMLKVPSEFISLDQVDRDQIILRVDQDSPVNSSTLARDAEDNSDSLFTSTGLKVVDAGIGKGVTVEVKKQDGGYVVLTFILVGSIAGVVLAVTIIYLIKRHRRSRAKLAQLAATADGNEASKDYQDLCRQRMQSKASEKPEPLHAASRIGSVSESQVRSPSSRSSTSSWSEEPAATNMDISTGHVVLSYMEDHLKNQDRLEQEWDALAAYQADPCSTSVASDPSNARKNRYSDVLPYDHSRVVLSATTNVSNSDYINASFITDHDPRNPAYITTQGPLPHTVADFWQMIWEQGSVVIVMLTKLTENGTAMCHRYWPEEGSDLYHIYEVHLVSEHIWCDDYLVRSFYLKNLQTNETRTVTQFHFLTWPHLAVPPSMKALLDFRRKVNKSFRGGSCPIVVHCNDGCGRSGTYCLIDMVLNRMAKGAKEIDMAATLEHIRDQRMNTVQTKEQFQFALSAVAEEVHAILKALPQ